ncbi:MAG: hypothetical protein VX624_11890, partial [Pseudomonadota bacterium]|nr:hypothetical protein [Pseudomonadota bacterium]
MHIRSAFRAITMCALSSVALGACATDSSSNGDASGTTLDPTGATGGRGDVNAGGTMQPGSVNIDGVGPGQTGVGGDSASSDNPINDMCPRKVPDDFVCNPYCNRGCQR